MSRYKVFNIVACVILAILFCSGALWATEDEVGSPRTIEVGGRTFEFPASRVSSDYSAFFENALSNMNSQRFDAAPLSIIGARITANTEITAGALSQKVSFGYKTQSISIVGATADIANPAVGQRVIVGGKIMEYRAADGATPAQWVDITNQGARVSDITCNVTIGNNTEAVTVVDSKPAGAPGQGEPTTVIYHNMVYEWQAGTGGESGHWKNITYTIVPAASVEEGSYEQTILVDGGRVQASIVTQVPTTEGSEYVVIGDKVYQWDDTANKYVPLETGTGEDEHPKIVDGSVAATVQMSGGAELADVPVFGQIPSTTGADDGDACVVVNPNTGRTSVYIFDAEANAWQRSTASYSLAAKIDRASATADVTIDGVVHQDITVVAYLPKEHTQGQDTIVVRSSILGAEKVYVWDAASNSWTRVAAAPEMGNVYQQFAVALPGHDFSGRARVVGSTDEVARPIQGQVVAVTGTDGKVESLQRYENGAWKVIHEFEAPAGTPPPETPDADADADAGSGPGAGAAPLVEPILTPAELGRSISIGRSIHGAGNEVIQVDRYANYLVTRINIDGGYEDVHIYQKVGEETADVYIRGTLASRYPSQEDVAVVGALPAQPEQGQTMVVYRYNIYVWKDQNWTPISKA